MSIWPVQVTLRTAKNLVPIPIVCINLWLYKIHTLSSGTQWSVFPLSFWPPLTAQMQEKNKNMSSNCPKKLSSVLTISLLEGTLELTCHQHCAGNSVWCRETNPSLYYTVIMPPSALDQLSKLLFLVNIKNHNK